MGLLRCCCCNCCCGRLLVNSCQTELIYRREGEGLQADDTSCLPAAAAASPPCLAKMAPKRSSRRDRVERVERVELDITNQAELRANACSVLSSIRQQRPLNTSQVYEPKQREWKVGLAALAAGLASWLNSYINIS